MKKRILFGLLILTAYVLTACTSNPNNNLTQSNSELASPSNDTDVISPFDVTNASENVPDSPTTVENKDTSSDNSIEDTAEDLAVPTSATEQEELHGSRDNTPICLVPSADGSIVYSTEVSTLDVSNASEGYIIANYFGTAEQVKFRITGSNGIVYTYDLHGGNEVFPLSSDSGNYDLAVYEGLGGNQYSTAQFESISVDLVNTYGPFLYPNQYSMFDASSTCVAKAKELVILCDTDLEAVSEIYNYIISNITYDYDKAANAQSGYLPTPDTLLAEQTGICLDYASLMVAMLRSQRIPTRLEVGYVGDAYHAWISTYITDVGWINGIIEFDGVSWKLMDPTFAASVAGEDLENFIGDGSSYLTKYMY